MASVMTFSKDEQETLIHYDYKTDSYTIESNIKKHIAMILRKYVYYNPTVNTVDKHGNPTSVIVHGVPKAITFRNVKQYEVSIAFYLLK